MNIRKTAAWMIALFMVFTLAFPACAEETEIPWGTGKDGVIEKLGKQDEDVAQEKEGYEQIRYRGRSFRKFDNAVLNYIFKDGGLIARMYAVNDSKELENYNYLREALTAEYGEPSDSIQTVYEGLVLMGSPIDQYPLDQVKDMIGRVGIIYSTWQQDSDTVILLLAIPNEDIFATALFYYRPETGTADIT